jgi:protein-disulfide isomerase
MTSFVRSLLACAAAAMVFASPASASGTVDHYLIKNAPLPTDYVLGSPSAPVVMVEYASLSCIHCAHFATAVLPELQKKYIDANKMRYILRQFPLNEPALRGAMLVDCMGEKGADKYYTFSHVLFDSMSKWAMDGNWQEGLQTIANVGGVDNKTFLACVGDTTRETKILKNRKEASDQLKITGTPAFYIDGELYEGDRTVDAMSAFIDAKLAAKSAVKK